MTNRPMPLWIWISTVVALAMIGIIVVRVATVNGVSESVAQPFESQDQPEDSALCDSLASEIGRLPLRASSLKESELLALNRAVAENCPHLEAVLESMLETLVAAAEHELTVAAEQFVDFLDSQTERLEEQRRLLEERIEREGQRDEWRHQPDEYDAADRE